ncbi:hypothetical protein CR513_21621, partial [Mucuna pruriens]
MDRVTVLSRFISRATETAMPIFGTLKKGGKFVWTPKCEEAFLHLKAMMAAPLVLIRPCPGCREEIPKDRESCLSLGDGLTKTMPILPEFQHNSLDRFAIRQVLRKPDLVGRMVAWSVQLSEFDILFEQRGHVKAQALANFITELTPNDPPNNGQRRVAEYEALLAGMRLARKLDAKRLTAKSDSKLVTWQVNNKYQIRDPQLIKYQEQAVRLAATFEKFILVHVPRDQNERVDLLAKLASTQRRG